MIGISIDLTFFYFLMMNGVDWNTGQVVSFLAGAGIIYIINSLWPQTDKSPKVPPLKITYYMMFQLFALFCRGESWLPL